MYSLFKSFFSIILWSELLPSGLLHFCKTLVCKSINLNLHKSCGSLLNVWYLILTRTRAWRYMKCYPHHSALWQKTIYKSEALPGYRLPKGVVYILRLFILKPRKELWYLMAIFFILIPEIL